MKRLAGDELQQLSEAWERAQTLPVTQRQALYEQLLMPCEIVMPLGELLNPKIAGAVWAWAIKGGVKTGPITERYSFNAQGVEGCFSVEETLLFAIRLWEAIQPSYRINVFVAKGALRGVSVFRPRHPETEMVADDLPD